MTTTDYLMNAGFVFLVIMQARERQLDRRALVVPLVLVFFAAQQYLHTIPVSGNDLVLVASLVTAGVTLGLLSGFATHVRAGTEGFALARVGWVAGCLLVAGICSRMVFAFAATHGAGPAIAGFSAAHGITLTAWPVALVSMAICEVTVRVVTVHLRGRLAQSSATGSMVVRAA